MDCFYPFIWLLKKSRVLSALACRLTGLTGKSKEAVHPKHLIMIEPAWYLKGINNADFILDLGCGSGQHSHKAGKKAKRVIGLDKSRKNLAIARRIAQEQRIKNIDFQFADLEKKLKFKNQSFDKILCLDILEHLNNREQFLNEARRVLKKHGLLFLSVPNKNTSWKKQQKKAGLNYFSDPDHKIEYSEKEIKNIAVKLGFKIKRLEPVVLDTPLAGFIDFMGGFSLGCYKRLSLWKKNKVKNNLKESTGFRLELENAN